MLEAAIAGLAAKREATPDYSETLGEIAALLEKMRSSIHALARRPAMDITPAAMAERIAAAAARARAEDAATINQMQERFNRATARMEYIQGTIATAREQRRQFHLWGIGGALAATVLCSFLPGFVARAMPDSWHLPERMAARTLDLDRWTAGERLLATSEPERWRTVVFANAILQDNRGALANCLRVAGASNKEIRCNILVKSALRSVL
ncbi:DUF6118 family protein [Sphingobium cloacae]|uniref:DUF6118 family protein n=1 Tax=Sphingobium cloacae TaxID=120107 RepID=UPI000F4F09E7|nr:DUF6118 family protein [Sphingobium cloacae]